MLWLSDCMQPKGYTLLLIQGWVYAIDFGTDAVAVLLTQMPLLCFRLRHTIAT